KIAALDEGSAEANACRTHFALARDALLRAFDWNFARVTVRLGQLQDPPARWAYKYALPVDCLRLRRLNDVPLVVLPETFCEVAAEMANEGSGLNRTWLPDTLTARGYDDGTQQTGQAWPPDGWARGVP